MDTSHTPLYEIQLAGHVDARRLRAFPAFRVTHLPDGMTLLTGPVADQAALFGLLSHIRDLGTPLISLRRRAATDAPAVPETNPRLPNGSDTEHGDFT